MALQEFLDRRKMTEFGSLALVDEGAGDGDGVNISLPGVRRGRRPSLVSFCSALSSSFFFFSSPLIQTCSLSAGDMSSRHFKPEIRVSSLRFSPTGRKKRPMFMFHVFKVHPPGNQRHQRGHMTLSPLCNSLMLTATRGSFYKVVPSALRSQLGGHHHRGPAGLLHGRIHGL